ncbi:MAG TPA: guanylate kinase [Candidatus Wallbacteria bacterium]|nr:guanylate kinase [Candidatus Wallbacteria bacterium]
MSHIFVISGPSGVGKSSIAQAILEKYKGRITYSISMTTRKIRYGEEDGREYIFTTVDDFERLIKEDAFIEYAKVHDNYYGTLKSQIDDAFEKGLAMLLDVDTKGALNIKSKYPEAVLMFIVPPCIEELKLRLFKRHTDAPEVIERRIHNAIAEIEKSAQYDYVVKNEDLQKAIHECTEIMEKHFPFVERRPS